MGNDSNILFYYNKRYAGGESRILQEGDIALGWLVKVSSYIGGLGGGAGKRHPWEKIKFQL